jgi:hypothetical protein
MRFDVIRGISAHSSRVHDAVHVWLEYTLVPGDR